MDGGKQERKAKKRARKTVTGQKPGIPREAHRPITNRSATTTAITIRTGPGSGAAAVLHTSRKGSRWYRRRAMWPASWPASHSIHGSGDPPARIGGGGRTVDLAAMVLGMGEP